MTIQVIRAEEIAQVIEQTIEATLIKVLQKANKGAFFEPSDVMTTDELLEYLRQQGVPMAKQTLFIHTHKGRIPSYKVGQRLRFKREDIDKWLEEYLNKGRKERRADKSAAVQAMADSASEMIKRSK